MGPLAIIRMIDEYIYVHSITGVITGAWESIRTRRKQLSHFHFAYRRSHVEYLGREPTRLRWESFN